MFAPEAFPYCGPPPAPAEILFRWRLDPLVLALLLAAAAAYALGIGSTKLADNVLAPVSRACPTGQDQPPTSRST